MFSPSFIHSSFLLWLYVSSRSSSSPLSLCLQFLFVLCLAIIHFNFPLCLCPPLLLAFPSPRLFPWPLSFTLPLCSSVKALRNYSQWFFSSPCLGLSWVLGWFLRSTKVSHSGCCEYISPITSDIHPCRPLHGTCGAANPISVVCFLKSNTLARVSATEYKERQSKYDENM